MSSCHAGCYLRQLQGHRRWLPRRLPRMHHRLRCGTIASRPRLQQLPYLRLAPQALHHSQPMTFYCRMRAPELTRPDGRFDSGQTGAGKTFTMQGPSADGESEGPVPMQTGAEGGVDGGSSGIIPRVLGYMFARLEEEKAAAAATGASYEFTCKRAICTAIAPRPAAPAVMVPSCALDRHHSPQPSLPRALFSPVAYEPFTFPCRCARSCWPPLPPARACSAPRLPPAMAERRHCAAPADAPTWRSTMSRSLTCSHPPQTCSPCARTPGAASLQRAQQRRPWPRRRQHTTCSCAAGEGLEAAQQAAAAPRPSLPTHRDTAPADKPRTQPPILGPFSCA